MANLKRNFSLILVLCLATFAFPVAAQSQAQVFIYPPDLTHFPEISFLADVFDGQGAFVSNLNTENISVLENGQVLTPSSVQPLTPPLQLVVAINSSPSLSVRDSFGFSRYEKASMVIKNWAAARPSDSLDDLSLVWNGGIITSHVSPASFQNRLEGFDPDLRNSVSGVAAISFALDVAQEKHQTEGVKPAILLVTDHLDRRGQLALEPLLNRAVDAGIRVHVWLIDSDAFLTHPGALILQDLALRTGGKYLTFTGSETLPDPEEWFARLRNSYLIKYKTALREGGDQTISVQVSSSQMAGTSPAVGFRLNILPPSALLLSPPIQIVRENPADPFDLAGFLPKQQPIEILIEFPDHLPRKLVRTTLYVNNQIVDENLAEPFDQFSWDLTSYQASAQAEVFVEVVDELGLSQVSNPIPVQVTVVQPPGGLAGFLLRNQNAMVTISIILAGILLLGILSLGGRRGWFSIDAWKKERSRLTDPLTQPVSLSVAGGSSSAERGFPAFPWLRRKSITPNAYLVRLTADGQPMQGDPLPLIASEITFGSDPTQASHVLDDPSISPVHARIKLEAITQFRLIDQNSVAGTWVNYELIPEGGYILQHGDMVNFGKLTYRFVLSKPPVIPTPTIISE